MIRTEFNLMIKLISLLIKFNYFQRAWTDSCRDLIGVWHLTLVNSSDPYKTFFRFWTFFCLDTFIWLCLPVSFFLVFMVDYLVRYFSLNFFFLFVFLFPDEKYLVKIIIRDPSSRRQSQGRSKGLSMSQQWK